MRLKDTGRPGLMLVCHGDVPEESLEDPEYCRLYGECLSVCGQMAGELMAVPAKDELSGFSGQVASNVSSGADGPVELAFMGFRKPGIREAMYSAMSAGARSIVCVGAGGLMLPGSGATVHLPAAIGQVMTTNPGLDVFYARPGTNPHVASSLVMASVESALSGLGIAPRPSGDMPRIGGETGVIVVSSHDQMTMFEACARQSAGFLAAVKNLSIIRGPDHATPGRESTGSCTPCPHAWKLPAPFAASRRATWTFPARARKRPPNGLCRLAPAGLSRQACPCPCTVIRSRGQPVRSAKASKKELSGRPYLRPARPCLACAGCRHDAAAESA